MITDTITAPVVRGATLENARWDVRGNLLHVLLTGEETGGAFGLVEIAEWPGAAPPRHIHHGFDEVIYVLDGDLTFELAGVASFVAAGGPVYVPKGTEHGFVAETERIRLLVGSLPGGGEAGFVDTSRPAAALTVPARLAPPAELERIVGALATYDSEITGPPVRPRR